MNCYFDGSVGGKSDEWLTLGGLAAPHGIWAAFRGDWIAMLQSRDPVAPYVHMTDVVTGQRPFRRDAGWTDAKKKQLVSDAIDVLGTIPTTHLCAFACGIDHKAHTRLR